MAQDAAQDAAGASGLTAPAPRASLGGFLVRVVLLAALLFPAWHGAAKPLSLVCGWVGARVVEALAPVDHARVVYREGQLVFSVEPDYVTTGRRALPRGTYYELTASALAYSYGLPFFLALLFASRPPRVILKALGGTAAILLLAGAAVGCDVLLNLTMLRTPAGESLFAFSQAAREAIALGYQLGALVFPALMPVVLWLAVDWRFVESLGARGKKVGARPLQE